MPNIAGRRIKSCRSSLALTKLKQEEPVAISDQVVSPPLRAWSFLSEKSLNPSAGELDNLPLLIIRYYLKVMIILRTIRDPSLFTDKFSSGQFKCWAKLHLVLSCSFGSTAGVHVVCFCVRMCGYAKLMWSTLRHNVWYAMSCPISTPTSTACGTPRHGIQVPSLVSTPRAPQPV